MTERQIEVLRFIEKKHRKEGLPPTIREICEQFHWASTNTAAGHLESLEKQGALQERKGRTRWLLLTPKGQRALGFIA